LSPDEAARQARPWADKATRLDHGIYTSRIVKAASRSHFGDWTIPARTGSADPFYDGFLLATGRLEDLIDFTSEKLRENPDDLLARQGLADAYYARRDDAAAIDQLTNAVIVDPPNLWPHLRRGRIHAMTGHYGQAIAELQKASALRPSSGWLGYAYARSGRKDEARSLLQSFDWQAAREYVSPLIIAQIYLGLEDGERTFLWLQKACDTHVERLNELYVDPVYDPIRADSRFQHLLTCVGLDRASLERWASLAELSARAK
jgi:tetratricopeptide (TPR) repeat protein